MTIRTTLLEVVQTVQDHADSDAEIVAVIAHLLRSGRVRLTGRFPARVEAGGMLSSVATKQHCEHPMCGNLYRHFANRYWATAK